MQSILIGKDEFRGELAWDETFSDLQRWVALEAHGRWTAGPRGLSAEWLEKSPSLFFKEKISGDFLWQTQLSRVAPDANTVVWWDKGQPDN